MTTRKSPWRLRLLTLYLGILGVSLIFQLFFIIPYIHDVEVKDAESHQNEVARNIAREFDGDISQTLSRTKELAERDIFRSMDIPAMLKTMNIIDSGSIRFESLSVLDSKGMFVSGTMADFSSYTTKNYADNPFFLIPFKEGETHFSKPVCDEDKDLFAMWASVPIESDAGERVGVLRAEFKLNHLIGSVKNYQFREEQIAYLIDNEGTVITRTENTLFECEDEPLSSKHIDCPMVQEAIRSEINISREYILNGKQYFVSNTQIKTNGWKVIILASMESVHVVPNEIRNRLLLFNIFLFGAAFFVTIIFLQQITASQRKREDELRESEETYRNIFQNAQVGLFRTSIEDGMILESNDQLAVMFGYKDRKELINRYKTSENYVDSGTREKMLKMISDNGEIQNFEARFFRKDGSIFWANYSAKIYTEKGWIEGVAEDITERKLAENEIKEKSEFLEQLIQQSPMPTFVIDDKGFVLGINEAFLKFYAVPDKDLLLGTNALTNPANIKHGVDKPIREALKGNVIDLHELEFISPHGNKKVFTKVKMFPIFDSEGKLTNVVVIQEDITERKQAEEALRESETKFRNLVQNLGEGIGIVDETERFTFVNPAAERIFGVGQGELAGRKMIEFVDDGTASFIEKQTQLRIKGVKNQYEIVFYRKDGQKRDLSITVSPQLDEEGKFLGALGIFRDVTMHKRDLEALRESEEKFREMAELLPEVIFESDAHGNLKYVNRIAFKKFGYSQEDFDKGINCLQCIGPADRKRAEEDIKKTLLSIEKAPKEYTALRKDGSEFHIIIHSSPIIYDGKPVGLRGIIVDITELKKIELQLKERVKELKALFDLSKIAERDNITLDELYQETINIIPSGWQYPAITFARIVIKDKEFQSANYIDSKWKLTAEIMIHKTIAGEIEVGYLEEKPEIDEGPFLKEERALLEALAETLGRISEKKTVEIEMAELEEQFRQAQKMEAIGVLAGGIAHDFNNILNVILGYSELLLKDFDKDDPKYKKIENIRQSADRATSLTRQLLAFSRKQILQPTILNLNDIVKDMENMLCSLIGEDIEFMSILDENLYSIKADCGQIEQVIMNLVVNARDAMPEGGKLVIETQNVELDEEYTLKHKEAIPGKHVMLAISDTGIGMTKEVQDRIFEPFFTTKEIGKGTGLGISTAFGIVKQSGGSIWVYSEPNEGTTFKIYFPAEMSVIEKKQIRITDPTIRKASNTVLVVEDNTSMCEMIGEILQLDGFRVFLANNSDDAISLFKEHEQEIDILLTDVVMPGMSGKIMVEQLQKINPHLKVLFMSGYTDNWIVHHGMLDPGIWFIQKPFMVKELIRKIYEVLDND